MITETLRSTRLERDMQVITGCRSCGSADLLPIWSAGSVPLANGLLTPDQLDQPDRLYPLHLVFCPVCSLVQIIETVAPDVLFSSYLYHSSCSDPLLVNARQLVEDLIRTRTLSPLSRVFEIGSNDGYLLENYLRAGIMAVGIEPAQNFVAPNRKRGIPTRCAFFGEALARTLVDEGGQADIIHANNVLAHIADLNGVVAGIAHLLKDDGLASIEVHYVGDLIDHGEFDTIYHEHLCYFSATSLIPLLERHGLHLLDVERVTTHGGTMRCFVGKRGQVSARVNAWIQAEAAAGMQHAAYYRTLDVRIQAHREALGSLLHGLKRQGKRIAGYGVPAKAAILLNTFGIGAETLDYAVDKTRDKQGRFIPGVRLPIYPPHHLTVDQPDYALLLAWNFADVILARETTFRTRGGKFIIPIPEVRIV